MGCNLCPQNIHLEKGGVAGVGEETHPQKKEKTEKKKGQFG
jgi:hypothetical protein